VKPSNEQTELRAALTSLRQFFKRSLLFSVIVSLLTLVPTLYMLEVYGRVVNSRNEETLLMLTVLVVALYAVMEIADWVRHQVMQAAATRLDRRLGDRVFNAAFEARLCGLAVGITPLTDLRSLRSFISSPASVALMDAPIALLFIAIIFAISVPLGAVVLVAAIAMLTVGYFTERRTTPPLGEAQKIAIEAQRYATTTLKNAQAIEAMGMMRNIRDRWLAVQRKFLAKQAEASENAGRGASISKFIQVAQSSIVLGFAAWLRLVGELDPNGSAMIVAWILSSRALSPLQQLIAQWKNVAGVRQTYDRLDKLLEGLPPREVGMPLPPPKGALSVEGIVAAAPGTTVPILRGVSFALAAGKVLAVVGPTASGKSTLARMLVGLWPASSGKVRLDGADVYSWNKQELGPHIGYLPQDNELFDGSFAENIARFGEVEPDKVEAAARAVGLHDMVVALPDGYDTQIGAGGSVLSGGQRQRVALARAIYGQPKFIVLDEPNSSLDEAGERLLLETLLWLKSQGTTLVVITHRTSVLGAVDSMLLLQDGQVKKFGPRDEVLAVLAGKPKQVPAPVPALAAN
jgi:ATP-binding cassette subfamily C exporter for protease/lipase